MQKLLTNWPLLMMEPIISLIVPLERIYQIWNFILVMLKSFLQWTTIHENILLVLQIESLFFLNISIVSCAVRIFILG